MPNISFYATSPDAKIITDYLNHDDEIAYLVADGEHRRKAVSKVSTLEPGLTILWHVPSGDLFYKKDRTSEELFRVADPWLGWETPLSIEMAGRTPFFEAETQTKTDSINFRPSSLRNPEDIGLSSIGWLGNHYSIIGIKAEPHTVKHGQKIRRWFNKAGVVRKRVAGSHDVRLNASTFPDAAIRKEAGKSFSVNPW
ncbi:MAG: hypothetical protein HQ446_06480 [Polaromonas sp.]|nr:hypothetical protein [Polaromonas sp.]